MGGVTGYAWRAMHHLPGSEGETAWKLGHLVLVRENFLLHGNSSILFSRAKISFCAETRTSCFRAQKFPSAWKFGHLVFARENFLLRETLGFLFFSSPKISFCVEIRASCFRARKFRFAWKLGHLLFAREIYLLLENSGILFSRGS